MKSIDQIMRENGAQGWLTDRAGKYAKSSDFVWTLPDGTHIPVMDAVRKWCPPCGECGKCWPLCPHMV